LHIPGFGRKVRKRRIPIVKHKALLLAGLLAASALAWAAAVKVQDLPLQHRKWLEEDAAYLIGPGEKEVFLSLTTDRQRDLFIEAFWKQRNPDPKAERNAFREEHYRRMAYANRHFGRGSALPGWKTDRGRIHIILGPPRQDFSFDHSLDVVPVQVWFYQGFAGLGLPDSFSCVFYKPTPAGEYELYSPVGDGPAKLLRNQAFDQADFRTAYSRLELAEPDVARVSLSLIEGEGQNSLSPSLASQALLNAIAQLPFKTVDPEYAVKFQKYKDIVEVEYSANYIGNHSTVAVIPDPSGLCFVHYAVEFSRLSVEDGKELFSTTLEANGKVSDKQGRVIFQFERTTPVNLTREQVDSLRRRPFSLQGLFPLAEGSYDLSLIIKNAASKEFTTVEDTVVVPAATRGLAVGPLLIGYGARDETAASSKELRAFLLPGLQLYVSPLLQFMPSESLQAAVELLGPAEERAKVKAVRFDILDTQLKVVAARTVALENGGGAPLLREIFDLRSLAPADYRLSAVVLDGAGRVLVSRTADFGVSPARVVPRPLVFSDPMPPVTSPVYAYVLGGQYFNRGDMSLALGYSEDAYRREPSSQRYALGFARILMAQGRYQETRSVLEPFLAAPQPEAETLEFVGRARQSLGDLPAAVTAYLDFLNKYGVKLGVLNELGVCYAGLGDTAGALRIFEQSLKIKPDQDEIRKAMAGLKK
jgi:GWxTD domain-containing protein